MARRLEKITSPRGTTTIAYDPDTRHVASIITPEGNGLHYEMDGPLVKKVTWTGEVEGSVERTYDANLRVATISVNGANPIAYTYDDDGMMTEMSTAFGAGALLANVLAPALIGWLLGGGFSEGLRARLTKLEWTLHTVLALGATALVPWATIVIAD